MCNGVKPFLGALSVALSLAVGGCGAGRAATYPVSGVVRFEDGEPVRFGVIEFRPKGGGASSRAKLDNGGRFTLGTYTADDGAAEGTYQVVVVQYFNSPPRSRTARMPAEHEAHDRASHPDVRVAPEFGDYASSPLRATVRPGSKNEFEFVVARHAVAKRPPRSREN